MIHGVEPASTAGQSFADGEWRRKVNGIVIVGPAALLAEGVGSQSGGKPNSWRAKRAKDKVLSYGSGHGGSGGSGGAKSQGKGKKGEKGPQQQQQQVQRLQQPKQQGKGGYKGPGADLGGGNSGKVPVYKPTRSGPWVRCQCPTCPGYGNRASFKYIADMEEGSVCLGCGTEWDFSFALSVQQGEVPNFTALADSGAQAGPFAKVASVPSAPSPFVKQEEAVVPEGPWEADHFKGFQKELGSSAFAKSAIPKAAIESCPETLRTYLPLLCFGKADTKGYKECLSIFETKGEAGDEGARRLLQAVAIGRTDAPAIRPAIAKQEAKALTAEQERRQIYAGKQAALAEEAKTDKAVEFSLRAISKAEDEVAERERDLTEAKDRLAMEKTLYQDNLLKHKAARSALQLEEQKLEAYRIRQQSQRMAVPEDEKEPEKQQNSGLTTSQEQEVLAAIGRRFGEQAGHIQQILGPIAEILVAVLKGSAGQPGGNSQDKVVTMVSAMDDEAKAEMEHINSQEEVPQAKTEADKDDNSGNAAMEAETERASQTKRTLEQEDKASDYDDLFNAQEQHDIEQALELSKAEASGQEEVAHGPKSRRLGESQTLTGSELAAKVLEDLETTRKELEAKPGSSDPAAGTSASSASTSAGAAGSAGHDADGKSSPSGQGAPPALG